MWYKDLKRHFGEASTVHQVIQSSSINPLVLLCVQPIPTEQVSYWAAAVMNTTMHSTGTSELLRHQHTLRCFARSDWRIQPLTRYHKITAAVRNLPIRDSYTRQKRCFLSIVITSLCHFLLSVSNIHQLSAHCSYDAVLLHRGSLHDSYCHLRKLCKEKNNLRQCLSIRD